MKKITLILLMLISTIMFVHSRNSAIFATWIERTCKPFDKGKLTAFPHFSICQHKLINVSNMLKYEDLPNVNSERWLSSVNFDESYQISNYGRARSIDRTKIRSDGRMVSYKGKILRQNIGTNGYLYINLGKRKTKYIHRCVALAFLPTNNHNLEVDHINGNKRNNLVNNLRWLTHFQNASRANKGKTKNNRMENNPRAKKVVGLFNGEIVETFNCAKYLSIKYGIHYSKLRRYLQNGSIIINNITYSYGTDIGKKI